jgi:hypothetical protein
MVVKPVICQVIHLIAQPGGGAHCGIRLSNIDAAATDKINSILKKIKAG